MSGRAGAPRDRLLLWTVGPGLAFMAALFVAPMALVALLSVLEPAAGGAGGALTLEHYRRAFDPLYLGVIARSAAVALATTALCLAAAWPAAWAIRAAPPRRRGLLIALVVVPSWMNLLVKNYAWIAILRRQGLANTALLSLGVVDEPLTLLFATPAVLVGLVHSHLPFMVLPLVVALDRMDGSLVEAARDLGAGRWAVFRRVVLPQTRAGVAVGCTLVFVPALGAFVTPDLLGGPASLMIGTLVEAQVLQARDWPFAAALSVLLMAVVTAALALARRARGAAEEPA